MPFSEYVLNFPIKKVFKKLNKLERNCLLKRNYLKKSKHHI